MDIQAKAIRARALCDDEVLNEALEASRDKFYEDWLVSSTVQEREEAHARTMGLSEILTHLTWLASQYEEPEEEVEESATDTL